MRLRELKNNKPDRFDYRGKEMVMVHYSMSATHKGKISDEIVWESEDRTICINYYKGYIYAENEQGEILSEVV